MVKDWDQHMEGTRFKSQWGQRMRKKYLPIKKKANASY